MFEKNSALAHLACKMVAFLDGEMPGFMPLCCLVLIRWTLFISEPDYVYHWSRVATASTSWDKQACTHDTLWCRCYITTSKEYLINCHILLKYLELVFLWLQLVKNFVKIDRHLSELWKKIKRSLFMKCRVTLFHYGSCLSSHLFQ